MQYPKEGELLAFVRKALNATPRNSFFFEPLHKDPAAASQRMADDVEEVEKKHYYY